MYDKTKLSGSFAILEKNILKLGKYLTLLHL